MFKNILVPVAMDHGEIRDKAIAIAKSLRDGGGSITLLHILEEIPGWVSVELPEGISEKNRDSAKAELNEIAESIGAGVQVVVLYGHAGRSIVEYSDKHKCDCVVIASHQPGLGDYLLGSTAAKVARHADASVLVVR